MNNEFIIGTFNVKNDYKNRDQNYEKKVKMLIKYIYDNNIYCLGLQEVTKKYSMLLQKLINKNYKIHGEYRFKNIKFTERLNESVKILTKSNCKNSSTIYLSKFPFFPRIMTTVETDDFLFINVHLEYWSDYFRKQELNNLYNYIYSNREKNVIIVGDFNIEYDDKNSYFLEFINKLSEININVVNNENNTFENQIIDFIFVSNNYEILNIWVENDLKEISDHNPLLVKIRKK